MGKPCFHLAVGGRALGPEDLPPGPCFVGAKVPVEDAGALLDLQGLGFRVVDTNVQLARPAAGMGAGVGSVRFARPPDEPGVRSLARAAFTHSRFHRDPDVGVELAGRIKEEWAANFFAGGRGHWMVVAEEQGGIVGFLQLLAGAEQSVVIDLVAVAEAWRGRAVARSMIAFASTACRGEPAPLRVGTQLANAPSLRLYTKLGFALESASYVLHLHREVHAR